jgi:UBX domain-containing protein 6
VAVTPAHTEELQHCVALIASQGAAGVGSMQVLSKLLTNLLSSPQVCLVWWCGVAADSLQLARGPTFKTTGQQHSTVTTACPAAVCAQDAKFRQLRLGPEPNAKIRSAVLEVAGALELLQACGFEVHDDEAEGGPGSRFAAFLDDARLSLADAGLLQLQLVLSVQQQQQGSTSSANSGAVQVQPPTGSSSSTQAAAAAASSSAAAAAAVVPAAVPRDTRVLLPAAPDTEVPDWFFERTTADIKAEFMHLRRQRASNDVFSSKAWKEQSGRSKMQPAVITLRVRFPEVCAAGGEWGRSARVGCVAAGPPIHLHAPGCLPASSMTQGVCLQGCFGTREPLSAVYEWVTDSLRQPGATTTLVGPDRKPLSLTGTVRDTGFVGAVLLLFRAGCPAPVDGSGRQLSWLSDEQLQQARVD